MARLEWDKTGERFYETGVSQCVLYPQKDDGTYDNGVAWNGITSISENPDGADANDLWADNIKYASLRSAETLGLSIEAYMYPEEFAKCDGTAVPSGMQGVYLGQQKRRSFGLCYRTEVGNDTMTEGDDGYKIHIIYGCTASPSEKSYETINDSPDAITFGWDVTTLPVSVTGSYKPVSSITIDTAKYLAGLTGTDLTTAQDKIKALEDALYGTDGTGGSAGTSPTLPDPDDVLDFLD